MTEGWEQERARFWELLGRARAPVAITGAGVSAESGVPTFRGPEGLWKRFRPEELATPEAFARDPELVWRWYDWRRTRVAEARPNPAHRWLAGYEATRDRFLLVTQNVDGLHRLAGSRNLVEIHGSLWRTRCTGCGREEEDRRVPLPIPPRCNRCGALLRPAVVWFGEALPQEGFAQAVSAVRAADLLLVLGTSAVVYPVAGLPDLAPQAALVEINPEPTGLSPRADLSVRAPAGRFLAPLLDQTPPAEGGPAPHERREGGNGMKKVWVDDECIACGTCVDMCPEVFELEGEIATVREDADLSLDDEIVEAAEACPVEAIHYED